MSAVSFENEFRAMLRPVVEDAAESIQYAYDGFTVAEALSWFDAADAGDLQTEIMGAVQNGLLHAMRLRRSDDESCIIPA